MLRKELNNSKKLFMERKKISMIKDKTIKNLEQNRQM
jgi:hypothetical protein